MRKKLRNHNTHRLRFRAIVERFGKKRNYHGFYEETILLKQVFNTVSNELVTDHIWFTAGKTWLDLKLMPGDHVEFDARVGMYEKGYVNYRSGYDERTIDYKLNRPTKLVKLTTQDLPVNLK